jgi:hypothetical protein
MPHWVRLLSCSVTGLVFSLTGFLVAAAATEGGAGFWQNTADFAGTAAFWQLVWIFAAMVVAALLVARVTKHLYGVAGPGAGLMAGGAVALIYSWFVLAAHARDWGGLALSLQKAWPDAGLFILPFALSGAFTSWLWDRLD